MPALHAVDWDGLSGALVAAGTFVTTLTGGWAALRAQRRPPGQKARQRARRDLRRADRRMADAEAELEAARVQRAYAARAVLQLRTEDDEEAAPVALRREPGPWTADVMEGVTPSWRPRLRPTSGVIRPGSALADPRDTPAGGGAPPTQ